MLAGASIKKFFVLAGLSLFLTVFAGKAHADWDRGDWDQRRFGQRSDFDHDNRGKTFGNDHYWHRNWHKESQDWRERHGYWHHNPSYYRVGEHYHYLPHNFISFSFGNGHYYFSGGMFYKHDFGGYVAVEPPVGAIVVSLPSGYQTFLVDGQPYYYYNDVYYRYTLMGYEVVPEPLTGSSVLASAPANGSANVVALSDSFAVNVPNRYGGYTSITLKKSNQGYIGPQGEFYTEFPSVQQLQVMYGG